MVAISLTSLLPSLGRMVNFLASGFGFQATQPPASSSAPQGRQLFSVPSFVSTFVAPTPAISCASTMVSSPLPVPSSDSTPISSLPSGPLLPSQTQNLQTCLQLMWLCSWVRWRNLTKTSVCCWVVAIKSQRRTVKLPLSKMSDSDHERVDMEASLSAILDSNTTDKVAPRTGDAFLQELT